MSKRRMPFAAGLLLLTGTVQAQEALEVLELSWVAPPECPQAADVEASVLGLIGGKALGSSRLVAQGAGTEGPRHLFAWPRGRGFRSGRAFLPVARMRATLRSPGDQQPGYHRPRGG